MDADNSDRLISMVEDVKIELERIADIMEIQLRNNLGDFGNTQPLKELIAELTRK